MLVTLDESLATSERAYADIWNAFHGRVTSLGPKTALLRSYAALALEHHESIALLIRNGLSGSALALARPVIEIMWHAGWANAFADDKQIEEILNGRFRFPPARAVVKALDQKYETGTFFQDVHSGAWNELDGYTHSGGRQPPARFTDMDIQPSYTEAEKIRVLTSSLAAAGMTVIVVLKAHGRMEDAARVEQTLLSTGARLADCRLVIGQP